MSFFDMPCLVANAVNGEGIPHKLWCVLVQLPYVHIFWFFSTSLFGCGVFLVHLNLISTSFCIVWLVQMRQVKHFKPQSNLIFPSFLCRLVGFFCD